MSVLSISDRNPTQFLKQLWKSVRRWPLGIHLLLAVNVPLGILLAGLLAFEYQSRMDRAITEKELSLADEAVAVHQAVLDLMQADTAATRGMTIDFIERVCKKMQKRRPTNHTIIVACGERLLHNHSHCQATIDADAPLLQAFRSGTSRLTLGNEIIVLGGSEDEVATVVVAELTTNIRRLARGEVLWHLSGLMILSVLAALIVDAVLWRLIRKPIRGMLATVRAVGRGEFGVALTDPVGRELQFLTRSLNDMSESLATNERQRRLQMDQAREIQQHLLPCGIQVPGLSISHCFQPADNVGGDYFDFIPLSNGSWMLVVADIAGHGIPAAMAATILKSLLLCASQSGQTPCEILKRVDRQFTALLPCGRFATLLLAIWQPETRRLSYVNAGHPPGLIWNPTNGFREMAACTMPVGIIGDASIQSRETELLADDQIIWFTDGLIEAFSPQGKMFGIERLQATIAGAEGQQGKQLLEAILAELNSFVASEEYKDDLTLLVIR